MNDDPLFSRLFISVLGSMIMCIGLIIFVTPKPFDIMGWVGFIVLIIVMLCGLMMLLHGLFSSQSYVERLMSSWFNSTDIFGLIMLVILSIIIYPIVFVIRLFFSKTITVIGGFT